MNFIGGWLSGEEEESVGDGQAERLLRVGGVGAGGQGAAQQQQCSCHTHSVSTSFMKQALIIISCFHGKTAFLISISIIKE